MEKISGSNENDFYANKVFYKSREACCGCPLALLFLCCLRGAGCIAMSFVFPEDSGGGTFYHAHRPIFPSLAPGRSGRDRCVHSVLPVMGSVAPIIKIK